MRPFRLRRGRSGLCMRSKPTAAPPDLAAIRARADEYAASVRAVAAGRPDASPVAEGAHMMAVHRRDDAARASAADVAALCDALDAAQATMEAQAAEIDRITREALGDTREAIAAYKDAHARADEVIAARALAADALRLGLEECERLRAALRLASLTDRDREVLHRFGRQAADEADALRWGATVAERDALRAEVAGLRAVVEGRTEPPTETKGDDL